MSNHLYANRPRTAKLTLKHPTTPDLVACPECGATSEVVNRFTVGSTEGPVEHLRIRCLFGRHNFTMPASEGPDQPTRNQSRSKS
ncbi:MAG: hypothetical protein ABIN79_09740 [Marmoricola sp.]